MNFRTSGQAPYEMYVYLGRDNYALAAQNPEPDLSPYVAHSLTGLAYGLSEPESMLEEQKQPENLEGLTDGISLAKWTDPIGAFMSAKKNLLGQSVSELLEQITEREKMTADHLYHIDYESCQAQTRIYEIDFWQRGLSPAADRVRSNLEKEMSGLEREKRMEEIACWRDVSRLRTELRTLNQEWAMEKQKESLLDGSGL